MREFTRTKEEIDNTDAESDDSVNGTGCRFGKCQATSRFRALWFSGRLRELKQFWRKTVLSPSHWLAVLAGLLLTAAFPKINIAGFAWIAPGLMLFAALGKNSGERFRLGYIAGAVHYLSSLYWLLLIPFPGGAVVGWLALGAYCAIFPGLWVWLCWRMQNSIRHVSQTIRVAQWFSETTWLARLSWCFSCAALWVALEMIRARLLTGFPWNFVGVSQFRLTPLIQIASVTGVYGISFLIVWFSVSLGCAGLKLAQKPGRYHSCLAEVIVPLLATLACVAGGFHRLAAPVGDAPILKMALVQPGIRQEMIFDPKEDGARFEKLLRLSKAALASKPDVLVWPEASMPNFSEENFAAIIGLISSNRAWFVFGADDVEIQPAETNFFNSAFLFDSSPKLAAKYQKRRLVIFGEYIPFSRWLPFLGRLIPIGNFAAGKRVVPFVVQGPRARMALLICFEDSFPHGALEGASDDTDFLLNLTNDGWFGHSAAQWQHAVNALFRAVENGMPLVRCTNNGLTCWVDEFGRLRGFLGGQGGDIYEAGFLPVEIPLRKPGENRRPTFYRHHGDWFGWGCVGWSIWLVASSSRRRPGIPN